jgi:hypothetical protein
MPSTLVNRRFLRRRSSRDARRGSLHCR